MAQGSVRCSAARSPRLLHESTGSWIPVFAVIITMDFATAFLAFVVLKPMRQRWLHKARRDTILAA